MTTDGLETIVRAEQERWTAPGVAWGVLRDGEERTGALGVAKLTTGEPMRTDSLCRIASISKVSLSGSFDNTNGRSSLKIA